jgi:hypothetical protein
VVSILLVIDQCGTHPRGWRVVLCWSFFRAVFLINGPSLFLLFQWRAKLLSRFKKKRTDKVSFFWELAWSVVSFQTGNWEKAWSQKWVKPLISGHTLVFGRERKVCVTRSWRPEYLRRGRRFNYEILIFLDHTWLTWFSKLGNRQTQDFKDKSSSLLQDWKTTWILMNTETTSIHMILKPRK